MILIGNLGSNYQQNSLSSSQILWIIHHFRSKLHQIKKNLLLWDLIFHPFYTYKLGWGWAWGWGWGNYSFFKALNAPYKANVSWYLDTSLLKE